MERIFFFHSLFISISFAHHHLLLYPDQIETGDSQAGVRVFFTANTQSSYVAQKVYIQLCFHDKNNLI